MTVSMAMSSPKIVNVADRMSAWFRAEVSLNNVFVALLYSTSLNLVKNQLATRMTYDRCINTRLHREYYRNSCVKT